MTQQNKWYDQSGELGDIVVSTRVRLARNLKEYPFPHKLDPESKRAVCRKVRDALKNGGSAIADDFDYIEMDKLSDVQAQSLVEKHLASREFAASREGRALLLKKDESVSIMLCEEDHIRIQVMAAGLALKQAYDIADKIDTLLDSELHFAFDAKLGYLTVCPTNIGTGMRASLMLHLPMLQAAGGIDQLVSAVSKVGLTLRGSYGEGTAATGALYQLSNQITLGIDERSALQNLEAVASQVMEKEKQARLSADKTLIEDAVFRSLGILKYARRLTSEELSTHLSNVRMGVSMGIIKDVTVEKINTIFSEYQPAGLIMLDPEAASPEKRDILRAKLIREELTQ